MKTFVAILLALAAFSAQGQELNLIGLDCAPKTVWTPTGAGSVMKTGEVAEKEFPTSAEVKVSWRGWWCPDEVGAYGLYIHRCVEGRTCWSAGKLQQTMETVAASSDWVATLKTTAQQNTARLLTEEVYAWERAGFAAVDALMPVRPVDAAWGIATSNSGQRPSREVLNAVLTEMKTPTYLPAATQCDPSVRPIFKTTIGIWMAVKGQPNNLRWVCRKQ